MVINSSLLHRSFRLLFNKQKIIYIQTQGNSMYPLFFNNDVVGISKITFGQIQVNDIISFTKHKKIITHRVVYTSSKYLITKGDNNQIADQKVFPKQILGKVDFLKRGRMEININNFYSAFSLVYQQEIVSFCKAMSKSQLEFSILKGLPIHLYYQKKIPHKFYADCDVLINRTDFTKISSLLKSQGYSQSLEGKITDPEVQFSKKVSGITITFDVHFEAVFLMTKIGHLNNLYSSEKVLAFTQELFAHTKMRTVAGIKMPLLTIEYQLVYLILHLFHHNFKGYARYWLITEIIENNTINFPKITNIINHYKLNNYCYPVFYILHKYFSKKITKKILLEMYPNKRTLRLIEQTNVDLRNILSEERRHEAGVQRFKLLFILSPNNVNRYLVFLQPQVLKHIYHVLIHKTYFRFSRKIFLLFKNSVNSLRSLLILSSSVS